MVRWHAEQVHDHCAYRVHSPAWTILSCNRQRSCSIGDWVDMAVCQAVAVAVAVAIAGQA
jgi:hypothetical protein